MYQITVPTMITNGHFNKEKTLAELKRCGAKRVALAIDRELEYSFSSPKNLNLLKELIPYYRDNGFEILVWLGETFGHSGEKQKGEKKYTGIRTVNNGDTISAFCPLDEKFKTDFCKWIKDVAECGPDMIMLDDDFRLGGRGDLLGCCCDKHMQRFNQILGEETEIDNLKNLLFSGGKNKYRDAWLKIQKDSMEEFAAALRNALNEVNSEIRLGLCACFTSWGVEGWDASKAARIMAGNTKPFLRTIGAPYWAASSGQTFGEVIEAERSQSGCLPDGEVFTEGDTYPRPRTACPAAYSECFDMIMRADGRTDGILKYMLDYVSDADYETGYIDAMVKNKELYQKIDRLFAGKACVGVRPYHEKKTVENAVYDAAKPDLLNEIQRNLFPPAFQFTTDNSLPVTYEKGYVNVVFGEHARYITSEELKNGSIIDITAAEILTNRGIDVGVERFLQSEAYESKGFTDLPHEYHIEEEVYTRLDGGVLPKKTIKKENIRLISKYIYKNSVADGDFEYENADGMKFRILSFDALEAAKSKGWLSSYAKRRSIIKSIRWLGKGLEIYPNGNYPRLYVMTKKNNTSLSIGMWNVFADKIENLRLHVEVAYQDVRFINCKGHVKGNSIVLDGVLYPYEFAGAELIM